MYADSMSRTTGAHVERSSQSKGVAADRTPSRVGTPRALSRSTTRRPVLPVPPITNVGLVSRVVRVIVAPLGRAGSQFARLQSRQRLDEAEPADETLVGELLGPIASTDRLAVEMQVATHARYMLVVGGGLGRPSFTFSFRAPVTARRQ
jgi:hypothetical protein